MDRIVIAPPCLPANRKFGLFFIAVFSGFGVYAYWEAWVTIAIVALIAAVLFAIVTLIEPQFLSPLNRLWYELGSLLGKIVSPIILGIIFFMLITPISLVTRLFGRDELKIKKRLVNSYWLDRSPPGPPPESFKKQF